MRCAPAHRCSRSAALEKRRQFYFFLSFVSRFLIRPSGKNVTVNFNASRQRQRTPPRDLIAFRGHGTFAHGSWMDTCDNKKRDAMCTV
jgi:hypothetical protein